MFSPTMVTNSVIKKAVNGVVNEVVNAIVDPIINAIINANITDNAFKVHIILLWLYVFLPLLRNL